MAPSGPLDARSPLAISPLDAPSPPLIGPSRRFAP
jgi:hypothetical protein